MELKRKSFEIARTKGEIGERIVRERMEAAGWVVYFPFTKDRAHYFDMLASKNKEHVIALDVKAKARLNKFPAQGINKKSHEEYMAFANKTNIPFWIIFVDDETGDIHGQDIKQLKTEIYPTPYIVAWPLEEMRLLGKLTDNEKTELKQYNQRNYVFQPAILI